MFNRGYVILDNGAPVYDYLVDLIALDPLHEDPATGDMATVERLYATLRELQDAGEPVQPYVQDARAWLDEAILANAPEAPGDEEDG